MPIYTYGCRECGTKEDYLVKKYGAKPEEGCSYCHSNNLERIMQGQTFAISASTVIKPNGDIKTQEQANNTIDERLEPGIHITCGISSDGKETVNVSRVTAEGKVDASVTGSRPIVMN